MSKLLLHTCCAPCTTYVDRWLRDADFSVTGFFYNPNIQPAAEYEQRLLTMEQYAAAAGLAVIYEGQSKELVPGDCERCYRARLLKTAEQAAALDLDCFTTTLLISPYQDHELIREIGEEAGAEFGIPFFYRDFRMGYNQSCRLSRELGLYRQKYCGCGFDAVSRKEKHNAQASQPA